MKIRIILLNCLGPGFLYADDFKLQSTTVGENYDANLEMPGWDKAGFNVST